MNKATPKEMEKSLEAVEVFKKAGIQFVPVPVFSENDKLFMVKLSQERLLQVFKQGSDVKQKIDISEKENKGV